MKNDIEEWRKNTGLEFFSRPMEDPLKNAIELSTGIDDLDLVGMDKALLVLSNYHNYLSSQMGIINARVIYLEDSYNSQLDLRAGKYTAPSIAERKAIAIAKSDDLGSLKEKLIKEQAKQAMLRPILDSIKLKIDALKKIFDRRGRNVA